MVTQTTSYDAEPVASSLIDVPRVLTAVFVRGNVMDVMTRPCSPNWRHGSCITVSSKLQPRGATSRAGYRH